MPEADITVRGLDEVKKSLYRFGDKLGDKIVRDSLRRGANLIARQERSEAPKRTGRLRKNVIVRNSKIHKAKGRKVGVYITLRTKGKKDNPKNAYYGRFVHDGFKRGSTRVPPNPFAQRAYDRQKRQAAMLAIEAMRRGAEVLTRREGLR